MTCVESGLNLIDREMDNDIFSTSGATSLEQALIQDLQSRGTVFSVSFLKF